MKKENVYCDFCVAEEEDETYNFYKLTGTDVCHDCYDLILDILKSEENANALRMDVLKSNFWSYIFIGIMIGMIISSMIIYFFS